MSSEKPKDILYAKYPLYRVILYKGTTITHFILGGLGIMVGYNSLAGYLIGIVYLLFSFTQMYVLMPLTVCPSCIYHKMDDSLCISALNIISKKLVQERELKEFPERARGLFCHNNLYLLALVFPIVVIIPAVVLRFSFTLVVILIIMVFLLIFRFFFIFTRIACNHCASKYGCPNAKSMGITKTDGSKQ